MAVVGGATAGESESCGTEFLPRAFEKRADTERLPVDNLVVKDDVGMRGVYKSGAWNEKFGCGS